MSYDMQLRGVLRCEKKPWVNTVWFRLLEILAEPILAPLFLVTLLVVGAVLIPLWCFLVLYVYVRTGKWL